MLTGFGKLGEGHDEHRAKTDEALSLWEFTLQNKAKQLGYERNDAGKLPIIGFGFIGIPLLVVQDPEVVQDLFVSKNKYIDK